MSDKVHVDEGRPAAANEALTSTRQHAPMTQPHSAEVREWYERVLGEPAQTAAAVVDFLG